MTVCWKPEWCECPECGPLVPDRWDPAWLLALAERRRDEGSTAPLDLSTMTLHDQIALFGRALKRSGERGDQ